MTERQIKIIEQYSQLYLDVYDNVDDALEFLETTRKRDLWKTGFTEALKERVVERFLTGDRIEVEIEYKELFNRKRRTGRHHGQRLIE